MDDVNLNIHSIVFDEIAEEIKRNHLSRNSMPNLDVGECVVVGDAIMLPSKIILAEPEEKPKSATIDFGDRWYDGEKTVFDIGGAVLNLIRQARG